MDPRIAPGGARQGLTVPRSALGADSIAMLGPGSRAELAPFAALTALGQLRELVYKARCARRPQPCASHRCTDRPFRAPPAASSITGASSVEQLHCVRKGVCGQDAARLCSAE